jgi:sec-independent protein translocase protein TatA
MPIGPWELALVLVILLIIFGPGRLPNVGSAIGRGIREMRRASNEVEESVRGTKDEPTDRDDAP